MKYRRWAVGLALVLVGGLVFASWWGIREQRVQAVPLPGKVEAPAIAVNGSKAPFAAVQLRVRGTVTDLPAGASPDVSVYVGAGRYTPEVTGHDFAFNVFAAPDDMVRIEVDAPKVHYLSDVGSVGRLKRLSAGDGQVDTTEQPSLRVSPLSTALAIMARRVLGVAPATDFDIESAQRAMASRGQTAFNGTADFPRLAMIMARIADGLLTLPDGATTGYQVVTNETLLRGVMTRFGSSYGADYPFFSSDFAPLASDALPPANLLLRASNKPLDFNYAVDAAALLSRQGSGLYRLYEPSPALNFDGRQIAGHAPIDYQLSWRDPGEWVMQPPAGTVVEGWVAGTNTRTLREISYVRLRRLTVGQTYSLWASQIYYLESYPEKGDPKKWKSDYAVWVGGDLAGVARQWSGAPPKAAMPTFCMRPVTPWTPAQPPSTVLQQCGYAMHRFDPNGAGATEDIGHVDAYMKPAQGAAGATFTWGYIEASTKLRVSSADADTDYWVLEDTPPIGMSALYLARAPDGQATIGVIAALKDSSASLSGLQYEGRWHFPTVYAAGTPYPREQSGDELLRNPDRTGEDYFGYVDYDGYAWETRTPSSWDVVAGRVYDTRFRAKFGSSTAYVKNCAQAFASGASGCGPARVRYFRPLSKAGSRVYGIMESYTQDEYFPPNYAGTFTVALRGSFPIYYDCFGGACTTSMSALQSSPLTPAPPARQRRAPIVLRRGGEFLRRVP